jgi:hypothetical protein
VREVYDSIMALVPKPVWEKLMSQREQYFLDKGS